MNEDVIFNYLQQFAVDFWSVLTEMSPYLLFGFLVAGILSIVASQEFVERHMGGKGLWSLVKASVFGVPLPLCSCGVIPVSMSLRKHGASKGATVSFLLSTPQTGVDGILVTLSLLGPLFAIFKPVAAFVTGIIGGVFVNVFDPVSDEPREESTKCTDECCAPESQKKSKFVRAFKYGFVTLPRDIGKSMVVGLVLAAGISAIVPDGFFAEKLGEGILPMLVMMAIGIPIYVCTTASVPLAAAFIMKGISPGAALVFLMTGPATNAATLATIWSQLGKKTAVTYLIVVAGCALAAGFGLNMIAANTTFEVVARPGRMLPEIIRNVSAIALLVLLAVTIITEKKGGHHDKHKGSQDECPECD